MLGSVLSENISEALDVFGQIPMPAMPMEFLQLLALTSYFSCLLLRQFPHQCTLPLDKTGKFHYPSTVVYYAPT